MADIDDLAAGKPVTVENNIDNGPGEVLFPTPTETTVEVPWLSEVATTSLDEETVTTKGKRTPAKK